LLSEKKKKSKQIEVLKQHYLAL